MKNWLIRNLANENRYFPIFLGCLCVYALIGVVLFGVVGTYVPFLAKYVAILFLLGAGGVGAGFRIAHNLCYAKVMQDGNSESSV